MSDENLEKNIGEALSSGKERKFKQSLELAINLKDVDMSVPKNRIEETIILPKGRGKPARVGVFATGELEVKAKKVADLVINGNELAEKAENRREARKIANSVEFFMAEAPLMPNIGRYWGIILGPRAKMPQPVPPAIDPAGVVANLQKTVKVRSKDKKTFHVIIGTEEMEPGDVAENVKEVLKRIEAKLERGANNIRSVYIKKTMGPAVRLR